MSQNIGFEFSARHFIDKFPSVRRNDYLYVFVLAPALLGYCSLMLKGFQLAQSEGVQPFLGLRSVSLYKEIKRDHKINRCQS